jgi:hypothetical protein
LWSILAVQPSTTSDTGSLVDDDAVDVVKLSS